MDLFKFNSQVPGDGPMAPKSGEAINGATSVMWVERYAEPGEFEIVAPLSSDLKRFLPEGTLISHIRTNEVMMVENHEITENLFEDSLIKITGRSLVGPILDIRLVGIDLARSSSTITAYNMTSDQTYDQIVKLINDHIVTPVNANDQVEFVSASTAYTGSATSEARTIERGTILAAVLELLDIDNLGIRSSRGPSGHDLEVYKGADRRNQVIFSWTGEDLKSSTYFSTNRKLKTTAFVIGRWVWRVVDTGGVTKVNRRMVMIDASDIDDEYESRPTGATLTNVLAKMKTRGQQKLRKQRQIKLSNSEISNLTRYEYRHDYFLGDLVTIEGDFNQQEVKRVIEYAEIMDENGYSSHPTLETPYEDYEIV